jgi:Domain of unknown function (DUF4349)
MQSVRFLQVMALWKLRRRLVKIMKVLKFSVFLSLLICVGCSQVATNTTSAVSNSSGDVMAKNPSSGGGGGGNLQNLLSTPNEEKPPTQIIATERKIIRNGELNLEATSPEEAQQKIAAIVDSKSGFVIESQQSTSDVKTTTRDIVTMTVRVPAEKFNETLGEIKKSADRVILETVKGEDVTEEFVDVEASLKTKKALEAQFLEIMKQGKTVEEALSVQTELSNVRGEIEKIEGRKRYLENQSSLSTIKIRLQIPAAFSGNSSGFFYELSHSVGDGFDAALGFVLFLVRFVIAVIPFLLFVVLPGYFLIRYFWRRKKKKHEIIDSGLE